MKTPWSEDNAVFEVQNLIFAKYGEPDFRSKAFHCYSDLPIAWRMPIATNLFEGEIANGGLAQFLWNTLHHHQRVLHDAKDGYELVGSSAHGVAVSLCINICAQFEPSCRLAVETCTADQDSAHFERWYADAESGMSFPEEELFETDSDIVRIKSRWILNNLTQYKEPI